jgi:hypothetical protein
MAVDYLIAEEFFYTLLANDAALQALVGNRVYSGTAPEGSAYPLVQFSFEGGRDVQEVAGHPIMIDELYVVKAVGKGNRLDTLKPIYERVHTLLQRASGTVADGKVIACVRQTPIKYEEIDNGITYRHLGGIYRIQSQ